MPHSSGIDIVASIRHCVARATHKVTDRAGLAAVHREIEVEQGQPCALPLPGRTGPARLMMYYKDTGGYARARLALREAAPTWSPRSCSAVADETARVHVTKRTGARVGQTRGGNRAGHGGAGNERAIRLARRRATKTAKGGRGQGGGGAAATAPGPREERAASVTTPPSPTHTPHRTYLSQRNRSSITRGDAGSSKYTVGLSIPLVEGRRALRGAGAEPERLATRAWGMSGPVRIQEQNRTDPTIDAPW